jgi:hypothetical protein
MTTESLMPPTLNGEITFILKPSAQRISCVTPARALDMSIRTRAISHILIRIRRSIFSLLLIKICEIASILVLVSNALAGVTHEIPRAFGLRIKVIPPRKICLVGLATVIVARIYLATLPENFKNLSFNSIG